MAHKKGTAIPNSKPFQKGVSGNPNGRPKGTRNRSTVAKQWLETIETVKNPISGQVEQLDQQDIMTLALIKKARGGDVAAYKELMDSAYGKAPQFIETKSDVTVTEKKKVKFVKKTD